MSPLQFLFLLMYLMTMTRMTSRRAPSQDVAGS